MFQTNVTMLRRLVRLEPEMFEGMRDGIWMAVEDMERKFEQQQQQQESDGAGLKSVLQRLWDQIQIIISNSDETTTATESDTNDENHLTIPPLSPQPGQDPTVFSLPGLEAIPFHTINECTTTNNCPCMRLWKVMPQSKKSPPIPTTGDIEALQDNYEIIKQELLDYLSIHNNNSATQSSEDPFQAFDPAVYTSTHNNVSNNNDAINKATTEPKWSSIYLYQQGIRQSHICNQYFPKTTSILEMKCPHLLGGKCSFGSVYFSKLSSGTKVKEHCGPTNIRWRCHLPLIVPKNKCSSSSSFLCVGQPAVNEQRVGWKEGKPILFDDSFLHSAVHSTTSDTTLTTKDEDDGNTILDGSRVVLIVDFFHPSLSSADRTALGVLYPPGS